MSDCLFCKIVAGEIPSTKVFEDERLLAFEDISPAAPTHILIIPKEHLGSIHEAGEEHKEMIGEIHLAAIRIANERGLAESGPDRGGYRIVNNCGADGGQTVAHLHFHLLGGRAMTWPPG
ncbi:MAG: histidine triad nucleotide-binding protein [Nitrospinaceae bacterium]|jgi:histidine triad (HIT) family protein|nr:histidine triad nucleotide-binding protein [Nitrospinaceae bacterium]MBT3435212.1 histidine triad nucleotide-binding protein [Nitrospinaceae bacterium]MBT3822579.1 histidine triad nucleotide-binding protein [Nitrospinaceae bacterium]MBT4093397.1 histidine triad nucleotide-binding protein [Nitrospinaceae bacterium]MBT4430566.1 histidine triad nucleotide-binding protein [Nitrospinaceae bacterium]